MASEYDLHDTVSFQMQPTISHHLDHPEFQSLEPVLKKQRTEQMKESLPDLEEISLSCGSCSPCSFKFSEELEETCDDSNQVRKACFNWGDERRFYCHKHRGSPDSPEGLMPNQLAVVHLPEIKILGEVDPDTRSQAHICASRMAAPCARINT